jgi:hypothetical protein
MILARKRDLLAISAANRPAIKKGAMSRKIMLALKLPARLWPSGELVSPALHMAHCAAAVLMDQKIPTAAQIRSQIVRVTSIPRGRRQNASRLHIVSSSMLSARL